MGVEDKSWAKALVSLVTHCGIDDFAEINFLSDLANEITIESKLSDCCNAFSVVVGNNIKPCAELARNVDGAWKEVEKRKEFYDFFSKCCSYCNKACTNAMSKSGLEKKVSVITKFNTDCVANFCAVYNDVVNNKQNIKLIAALQIDDILYSVKEMSLDDAIAKIKGDKLAWPPDELLEENEKQEILNWYLDKIRIEIRHNFTLVKSKIECDKCGKSYEEGSKCGNCEEADNIFKKAQEQLDREISNITNNINQLIKENKFIDAEKKAKEKKELFGGEKYQEIIKKIEEAKQDHQDKVKKEKKDKKNEFDKALEKGNWSAAEELINDLEKFGEKRFDLQKQIDIKRNSVDFDAALKNGKWKEAEISANILVNLSVGKKEDYEEKIKKAKENFKEYLKKEYVEELQKFNIAISTEKYEDAKNALEQVKQIANTLKNYNEKIHSLEKEEKQLKELQEELIVKALQKVENLNVVVSKEISKITWKKPADYNNGWQIKRKENNAVYKIIKDFTNKNEIEDKNIQQGVEYKYSIIPAYKNGKTNEILLNEENAVESDTVFFVENIKNISGSGEGIDDCASIELNWEMPKISNAVIEITRKPEFSKKIKLDGYNVAYSDTDVKIGKSYIYTLTLQCLNKQIGAFKSDEITVYQAKPLPAFNEVQKKKTGDGKYSLEWNWLGNESGAIIKKSNQDESIIVHKKRDEKSGSLKFVLQRGEKCDVTLTPFRKIGNKKNLGKETIFTFGEPTKIVCKLISHKKILFKSREPSILEITTDKSLPDLSKIKVCIGPSEPSSIYDGENLGSPKQDMNNKGKAILEIPKNCKGYVKIFLDNSISNEWKLEQPEGNYIK